MEVELYDAEIRKSRKCGDETTIFFVYFFLLISIK
jgi:hypothetical protein